MILVSTALAIALPGTVPAAAVEVNQVYPMPATGQVTVVGHGYGHGHGMSQYGAEGAARQGLGWPKILRFYYPGTTVGDRKGKVRVLISGDTTSDVEVSPRAGLRMIDTGTGENLALPTNGATRWRLNTTVAGVDVVAFRTDRWRRWKVLSGRGVFTAAGKPIRLHHDSGSTLYRGQLTAAKPGGSAGPRERDTVNVLALENYIKGALPREMPATWSPAAVRAQAVAARTYAAYEMRHPGGPHYQLCDTSSCQVYGGHDAEHPAANRAVDATRFKILRHGGTVAFTQFSSSSGGWTSANQFPYLPAKPDPYDGWSGNPNHTWTATVAVATIERTWGIGNLTSIRVTRRDGNGQWKGRIERMELRGPNKTVTVSGDDFRFRLGLKSTWLNFRTG